MVPDLRGVNKYKHVYTKNNVPQEVDGHLASLTLSDSYQLL